MRPSGPGSPFSPTRGSQPWFQAGLWYLPARSIPLLTTVQDQPGGQVGLVDAELPLLASDGGSPSVVPLCATPNTGPSGLDLGVTACHTGLTQDPMDVGLGRPERHR